MRLISAVSGVQVPAPPPTTLLISLHNSAKLFQNGAKNHGANLVQFCRAVSVPPIIGSIFHSVDNVTKIVTSESAPYVIGRLYYAVNFLMFGIHFQKHQYLSACQMC